jgi:hypothetical protein
VTKWGVTAPKTIALTAIAIALCVIVARAVPASATGEGHGSVDDGTIEVGLVVTTDAGVVDVSGASRTPLLTWHVDEQSATTGDLNGLCTLTYEPVTLGTLTHLLGIDSSGVVRIDDFVCVPLEQPGHEVAPPIPALPTIEDAWRAANLPTPTVALDPAQRGVTGLTTHISTGSARPLALAVRLGAYTMTGTANPVAHFLRVDDEQPRTFQSASPLDVMFETKGVHRIEIGTVWHAATAFAGPLLSRPLTADIGTATITATRTYTVTEVRAVLHS